MRVNYVVIGVVVNCVSARMASCNRAEADANSNCAADYPATDIDPLPKAGFRFLGEAHPAGLILLDPF